MKINWLAQVKNKAFWVAFIPALLLAVKAIAGLFGFELDTTDVSTKLLGVVEAAFALLTILGVVVDPTTEGVSDSERAQSYTKPWTDKDAVQ